MKKFLLFISLSILFTNCNHTTDDKCVSKKKDTIKTDTIKVEKCKKEKTDNDEILDDLIRTAIITS